MATLPAMLIPVCTNFSETETASPAADMALPEGVTAAMVAEGKEIFNGTTGICWTCHLQDGAGDRRCAAVHLQGRPDRRARADRAEPHTKPAAGKRRNLNPSLNVKSHNLFHLY